MSSAGSESGPRRAAKRVGKCSALKRHLGGWAGQSTGDHGCRSGDARCRARRKGAQVSPSGHLFLAPCCALLGGPSSEVEVWACLGLFLASGVAPGARPGVGPACAPLAWAASMWGLSGGPLMPATALGSCLDGAAPPPRPDGAQAVMRPARRRSMGAGTGSSERCRCQTPERCAPAGGSGVGCSDRRPPSGSDRTRAASAVSRLSRMGRQR